jgi:hypothetical protein
VYNLQRQDYIIDQVNDNGSLHQFQIDGVDLTAYFQVGNTVYVDWNSGPTVTAAITASAFSGGNTLVTIQDTFVSSYPGGVVNNLSKRTDYRIEVEVFKASDDSSLTGGVKFSFTPGNDGIAYADVSDIVKAFLTAEWIEPSALNETEDDTSLKFYIKHQEFYDGALQGSQTSDSGNPRYAVFGALQIPSSVGNNLTDYVPADDTKNFLTLFTNPKLWRDYPATLSFIYATSLTDAYALQRYYNSIGAIVGSTSLTVLDTGEIDAVNKLMLTSGSLDEAAETLVLQVGQKPAEPADYTEALVVPDDDFTLGMTPGGPWYNDVDAGTNWTGSGGISTAPTTETKTVRQDLSYSLSNRFVKATLTLQWDSSGTYRVKFFIGSTFVLSSPTVGLGVGTDITFTLYIHQTVMTDDNKIGIKVEKVSGSTVAIFLISVALDEGAFVPFFAPLTLQIESPCNNPVMLMWKNSLGGDAFWLFEHGQESVYNFSGRKKAKRLTLFAENLTLDQWEAISELNHLGEVYQENIVEFTSSVNKSAVRDGSQVYVLDEDGNKTGVIVIPTQSLINTKNTLHSIEIEIEFPERYE